VDDDLRQTLAEYIAALQQLSELRKSVSLRIRSKSARFELRRKEWEASGPHGLEDSKAHTALLRESSSILKELSSVMQDVTDALNQPNDEMYERALRMCGDPGVDPATVLDYFRSEFLNRVEEYPNYEVYFTRSDEAYAKLDAFVLSQQAALSPPAPKKSWWR
jgi:uncharacterized protein YhaN